MNGILLLLLIAILSVVRLVGIILEDACGPKVPLYVYVGIFVVGMGIMEYRRKAMLRRKAFRLESRKDYGDSELNLEFQDAKLNPDELMRALDAVERATSIDKRKLRAVDRFDAELAPERGWEYDDGLGLLPLDLSKEFGVSADIFDLAKNPTVNDLLCTIANHLHPKTPANF